MKKFLLYISPFILAIILFAGLVYFVNQKTGKGALQVTASTPSEVYLNDKLSGETPLCKCEGSEMPNVGEYRVRIVPKDNSLNPYEEKIDIYKSTLTVIDRTFGENESASIITLVPKDDKKTADITVITTPPDAEVFLDDISSGKSPIVIKDVTESDHELRLKREGFIEKTLRIKATKGFMLKAIVYLGASSNGAETALPTVSASPTPSVSRTSKVLILDTPTGFLRVRSSSSTSTSEIGRVSPGETYDLLEETDDGWYKIRIENGAEGWITSEFAQKQ
jgi:hypothetical protein